MPRDFQYWVYDLNTDKGRYAINGETLDKIIEELLTLEDISIQVISTEQYEGENE